MAVARPPVILLVLVALALGACGTPDGAFVCATDEECTLGGTVGT